MSQPPSWSPDSLTGASAEISALQLVEREGEGGTEEERDGWRGERERKGRTWGVEGWWEKKGRSGKEEEKEGRENSGERKVQIIIPAELSSSSSTPSVIHSTSFSPQQLTSLLHAVSSPSPLHPLSSSSFILLTPKCPNQCLPSPPTPSSTHPQEGHELDTSVDINT